jgi:hypothetical protein
MLYQRLCIVLLLLLFPINSLAQETYLVAYAGFAGFQAPVWAPKDLGLFSKYGFAAASRSGFCASDLPCSAAAYTSPRLTPPRESTRSSQGADIVMISDAQQFSASFVTRRDCRPDRPARRSAF